MFNLAKCNASVKADIMTWTRYNVSVMQKFIVLAAPLVANALNTVAVAVTSHTIVQQFQTRSWTQVLSKK